MILNGRRDLLHCLRRLGAAVDRTGPEALADILESLKVDSVEKVDNLGRLKEFGFDA